jgi:hypothetical protein
MPVIAIRLLKSPWTWVVVLAIILIIVMKAKDWNPFDFFRHAGSGSDVDLTEQERAAARQMATELYTEMKGPNLSRDLIPWRKFMRMSEKMQKGTYQEFSTMYSGENRGTLTQWVKDEGSFFPSWNDSEGIASRSQILTRLSDLNLL